MVDASLVVSFDSESHSNDGISLELHRGFAGLRTGIPFRVYPQVEARLICEFGTISLGQQRYSDENELVVFTGSATATLRRPLAINVSLEFVSVAWDESGSMETPVLSWDEENQQVIADRPFYGAIRARYDAPYSLHHYQFRTEFDAGTSQTTIYADTILAFYRTATASLEMSMSVDASFEWRPLYKVTRRVVTDELGSWEYPPIWASHDANSKGKSPDDPSIPSRPVGSYGDWTTHTINPDMAFSDQRLHLFAEFNRLGRLRTSERLVEVEEPYKRSGLSFQVLADRGLIQFWFERIAKPEFLPSQSDHEADWYAAFQSFNWGEILEELNSDYPNIQEAR